MASPTIKKSIKRDRRWNATIPQVATGNQALCSLDRRVSLIMPVGWFPSGMGNVRGGAQPVRVSKAPLNQVLAVAEKRWSCFRW